MAKRPAHLLPEWPDDALVTPEDHRQRYNRIQRQRMGRAGMTMALAWVDKRDVDYLMTAWNLPTRSQLVRAALRHLLRQTQRGLPHLDGPPVGYD